MKQFINKTEQHNIDNTLNHDRSIKLYYKNQFYSNYKIDEHVLKNLIQKNVLPIDPTKKLWLIVYYNKFKTTNLIISNNSSPSTELDRTKLVYMFKYPLGDSVFKENNTYVGLTTTTLSRQLTVHLNDSSSIGLHFKTHSIPRSKFRKILVKNATIIAHKNATIIANKINELRLQILEARHIKTKNLKSIYIYIYIYIYMLPHGGWALWRRNWRPSLA